MTSDPSSAPFDDSVPDRQGQPQGLSPALIRALSAHPDEIGALMDELHRRVYDEDSLIDLLRRSSQQAVHLLSGVQWAGVTAKFAGPAFTVAHTDDRVLVVDEGQYGQGDGPCLQAIATGSVVKMTSDEVSERWPVLAKAVVEAGVRSFHAEPLHVRDKPVGCLNLYSAESDGLEDPDADVITVLTEYLDRGLTDYSSTQPGEIDARRLQEQLRARYLTNQAVGVVMARDGIGAEQAREALHREAIVLGCSVLDVALSVIDRPYSQPPHRDDLDPQ